MMSSHSSKKWMIESMSKFDVAGIDGSSEMSGRLVPGLVFDGMPGRVGGVVCPSSAVCAWFSSSQ